MNNSKLCKVVTFSNGQIQLLQCVKTMCLKGNRRTITCLDHGGSNVKKFVAVFVTGKVLTVVFREPVVI